MNFRKIKTLGSAALRCGSSGFGFRVIGNGLNQLVFCFRSRQKQLAFSRYLYQHQRNIYFKSYCKHAYRNGSFIYMVFIPLPSIFRLKNLKDKFFVKSFRYFCSSLGSVILCGSLYQHPHAHLSSSNLLTN